MGALQQAIISSVRARLRGDEHRLKSTCLGVAWARGMQSLLGYAFDKKRDFLQIYLAMPSLLPRVSHSHVQFPICSKRHKWQKQARCNTFMSSFTAVHLEGAPQDMRLEIVKSMQFVARALTGCSFPVVDRRELFAATKANYFGVNTSDVLTSNSFSFLFVHGDDHEKDVSYRHCRKLRARNVFRSANDGSTPFFLE